MTFGTDWTTTLSECQRAFEDLHMPLHGTQVNDVPVRAAKLVLRATEQFSKSPASPTADVMALAQQILTEVYRVRRYSRNDAVIVDAISRLLKSARPGETRTAGCIEVCALYPSCSNRPGDLFAETCIAINCPLKAAPPTTAGEGE